MDRHFIQAEPALYCVAAELLQHHIVAAWLVCRACEWPLPALHRGGAGATDAAVLPTQNQDAVQGCSLWAYRALLFGATCPAIALSQPCFVRHLMHVLTCPCRLCRAMLLLTALAVLGSLPGAGDAGESCGRTNPAGDTCTPLLQVLLCLPLAAPPVLQSSSPCPCSLSRSRQQVCSRCVVKQMAADRSSCADALVFMLLQSVQEQVKQEEAFALLAASMRAELADEPQAGDRIPAQSHNPAVRFVKTDPSEHLQA